MALGGKAGSGEGVSALRRVLGILGLLLVLVVVGFLVAGRLRARNWVKGLPGKLGIGITQDSNSFTLDHSTKGRKDFTLHAAKEVQRADGKVSLHDVGIVMYDPAGEPADRIHGADFTYDQKTQVLSAVGEVYLDLTPPAAKDASGAVVPATAGEKDRRLVHVKTTGLVFDQKQGVASSDGAVEFQSDGYSGSSVGASYDSKNSLVVLRSEVRMSGIRDERPVVLTASHAELDRKANAIDLLAARYVSAGRNGAENARANHAVIHTNADGGPERIDAEGSVTLSSDQRGTVVSDKLDMELGEKGQARFAHLTGRVRYASEAGVAHEDGRAEDAKVAFDTAGRPVHALMTGEVTFVEQEAGRQRNLSAATLDMTLAGGGKEPTVVRAAEAFGPGGATLTMVDEGAEGKTAKGKTARGTTGTDLKADRLVGRFTRDGKNTVLTGLDGMGHSWVQRVVEGEDGQETSKDTSTGDVLHVDFKPGEAGRSELTRAEQKGGVTSIHMGIRVREGKPDVPEAEHSRADDAVYEAGPNVLHLVGHVEVEDETSALTAEKVDVDRGTGDAFAFGAVKVTYVNPPAAGVPSSASSSEPLHVLAARAIAHKGTGLAEFFGSGEELARMWQGTSQVQAPVLDFYRAEKRLVAHGDAGSDAARVRAVLVSAAGSGAGGTNGGGGGTTHLVSQELVYNDNTRTVVFSGSVRVVNQDGVLMSKQATVWLTSSGSGRAGSGRAGAERAGARPAASSASGFMGGRVDHIVAEGAVSIEQPGRRGTGERLVYTAADGVYVLTGTKAAPPKVVDQAQGTTTGAALRFRSDDRSIEVLGSEDGKTAGRVRSETRMNE
jgi:lipopolysaccharide export system protein LptA